MPQNLLTAKQLAKLLDISLASVNYYSNLGLLKIKDKKGNVRLYDKNEVLDIFEKMCQLKREGYSLRLIQRRLEKRL